MSAEKTGNQQGRLSTAFWFHLRPNTGFARGHLGGRPERAPGRCYGCREATIIARRSAPTNPKPRGRRMMGKRAVLAEGRGAPEATGQP